MDNEASAAQGERLIMVVTLRSGVQIRMGVKDSQVTRTRDGRLTDIKWTLDDDPLGSTIGHLNLDQVDAIHYERDKA